MAITHAASQTFTPAAFVGTNNQTFDCGAGADRFLTVGVGFRHSGAVDLTAAAYNGVSLTQFGPRIQGGTQGGAHAYHLVAPASGSNTLALTNGSGTNITGVFIVSCYNGVDQTTPYDGYVTNGGSDLTAESTVSSATGDAPYMFAGGFASTPTAATPTNYTERGDGINGAHFGTGGEGTGAATVAMTATISAAGMFGWVTLGWNMNAASAGGGDIELVVQDALHSHTADSATLTQSHVLVVSDSQHGHAADSPALTQQNTLSVADAQHAHGTESPTLTQANTLAITDAAHAHTAESPSLTQQNQLAVQDALHAHAADSPTLDTALSVAVDDSRHAHSAESPALTQANILAPNDAAHAHTAESPNLTQASTLSIDDALHAHFADSVVLVFGELGLYSYLFTDPSAPRYAFVSASSPRFDFASKSAAATLFEDASA